jgi:hypothetical protein
MDQANSNRYRRQRAGRRPDEDRRGQDANGEEEIPAARRQLDGAAARRQPGWDAHTAYSILKMTGLLMKAIMLTGVLYHSCCHFDTISQHARGGYKKETTKQTTKEEEAIVWTSPNSRAGYKARRLGEPGTFSARDPIVTLGRYQGIMDRRPAFRFWEHCSGPCPRIEGTRPSGPMTCREKREEIKLDWPERQNEYTIWTDEQIQLHKEYIEAKETRATLLQGRSPRRRRVPMIAVAGGVIVAVAVATAAVIIQGRQRVSITTAAAAVAAAAMVTIAAATIVAARATSSGRPFGRA